MIRHAAIVLIALLCCAATGCEEDQEPHLYRPGGTFFQQLDARGQRHLIQDHDGKTLGKVRVRRGSYRVYDAKLRAVGDVHVDDESIRATPRGGEPLTFSSESGDVFVMGDKLRLERVERGWAVFDGGGARLFYVERIEDGRLAIRDDYSAAPRAYARPGEGEAKTSAGKVVVKTLPPLDSAIILPFVFDGTLEPLWRVALGVWFERHVTSSPAQTQKKKKKKKKQDSKERVDEGAAGAGPRPPSKPSADAD